ncbi:MAG: phosphotransferase enzyme family protein [Kiritimatiellia bacterium]
MEQFRGGHINQTFFITHGEESGQRRRYVMQRMNRTVFPRLDELMENVIRVSEHMQRRCTSNGSALPHRGYLHFIRTLDGRYSLDSEELGFWRLYRFIENAVGKMIPSCESEAFAAGEAFGIFQELLADLPAPRLHETISRFHDTRWRYGNLVEAARKDICGRLGGCRDVYNGLMALKDHALVIQVEAEAGRIPERVVHNDAKLSNVLLDSTDGRAVCVIDLDTCMPGLALHDFGDLMRSICSSENEDTEEPEKTTVRKDMFAALHAGYLKGAANMLAPEEKALLPHAGIVLTLEVAARFLADYLEGDVYFRVKHPGHNLVRARAQLTLAHRLIEALPELQAIAAKQERT